MELENKTYQLGDFVHFKDKLEQLRIGRIEDHNQDQGWYECFVYLTPEQIPQGRMSHHSIVEVFKTKIWERVEASKVIKQVYILNKLRDYQKLKDEKNLEDVFISRQEYDQDTQTFLPVLQKCLCGRFMNPDDALIQCKQCDKPYCVNCLKINLNGQKAFSCDYCRSEIAQDLIMDKWEQHKRNFQQATPEASKSLNFNDNAEIIDDDEEDEMEVKKNRPTIDLEKLQKKIKRNDSVPIILNNTRVDKSSLPPTPNIIKQISQSQPTKIKQFKNISQEKIDKIIIQSEMYRNQEIVVPNMPRKRLEVREKFLQLLMYGVEELRDLKDYSKLSRGEIQLTQLDDQALFLQLKKMVLEIEVSLHMKYNLLQRSDKLDPNYIERCKIVYMHMKDDKNFDLRRKVLSKEFTAHDLCNKDERELYNPERRKETLEMTKLNFDLDMKVLEQPIVEIEEEPEVLAANRIKNNQQSHESANSKHIQSDLYKSIQEYLPQSQLQRLLSRLRTELKPQHSGALILSLESMHKQT